MFRDTKYVRTMDSLGRVLIPKGALVALDVYGKNNTYSVFIDKETREEVAVYR